MYTMSFSAILVLAVFSALVVYILLWSVARLLYCYGISLKQETRVVESKKSKVIAKTEYFSEDDGWHVVFNLGFGTCYGILANLNKGQAEAGVEFEASILTEPTETCGFYELMVE